MHPYYHPIFFFVDSEVTIIGAGVVGLAIASELSRYYSRVFVIERHDHFGMETSSRNSEVIHSGIYYRPGTLKARLCREGRDMLYRYCRGHDIGYRKCGKLIVATQKNDIDKLKEILATAHKNDVSDARMITAGEAEKMEPHIRTVQNLFFPSSGIVDIHGLMQSLENESVNRGVDFAYGCEVIGLKQDPGNHEYIISILDTDGSSFDFTSRYVINSAGLGAEKIARMAGIEDPQYKTWFWKGEYFALLNGKHKLINRLVYPVPEPNTTGLGIHTTPDLSGRQKLGPNALFLEDGKIDYSVDPTHAKEFYQKASRFLPFLEPGDLAPDQAGIRPKLQRPGDPARDFIIREEEKKGFPGLVNLIGIESPGLTAALSIGNHVRSLLKKYD